MEENEQTPQTEKVIISNRRKVVKPARHRNSGSKWWIPLTIVLGLIAICFIALIGFFTYIASVVSTEFTTSTPVTVEDNSILYLDCGVISELQGQGDSFFDKILGKCTNASFYQITEAIKRAANDDKIKGIYFDGNCYVSGESLSELQVAIKEFKKSGKFFYSYLDVSDKNAYMLASLSDSIFVPEEGLYEMNGYGVSSVFPKGLYDKLGINFIVAQCEDFKSYADAYKYKKFSDSSRLAYKALITQKENTFFALLSQNRKITREQVIECMNIGLLTPADMLERKLADVQAPIYWFQNQFLLEKSNPEKYKELYGKGENKKLEGKNNTDKETDITTTKTYINGTLVKDVKLVSVNDYVSSLNWNEGKSDNSIAVIVGEGAIYDDMPKSNPFSFESEASIVASDFIELIEDAVGNDDVKGIIIRINSPGGSAMASEKIYQAIMEARKKKPVYASMGDVAASGGYYISMACEKIYAGANTITGSIGVVAAFPNVNTLLEKTLYMNVDTISNGIGNPFTLDPTLPAKSEDVAKLQKYADATYYGFVSKAAKSRNMSFEQMRAIAKGRVWVGTTAKEIGLVDAIGNIKFAIGKMREKLGIKENDNVKIVFYPNAEAQVRNFWKRFDMKTLYAIISGQTKSQTEQILAMFMLPKELKNQVEYIMALHPILEREKIALALPNKIDIK